MSQGRALTALVVPCYNESSRLRPGEFLDFTGGHPQVHFLMVDDGSGDGTCAVLEEMRVRAPERITTLRLEQNRGKAEAVRQGVIETLESGSPQGRPFELVGYWDADLSTPLATLPQFVEVLAECPACRLVMGPR